MYISLNWIKDFVNLDGIEVDELVRRFGLATAEVEGVTYRGQDVTGVYVAEIKSVQNHPDSQKLHILQVDDGLGELTQVVCGAPNVRVGLKTAFARVGANVRGNKISKAKLAGIESFGMCCGEDELGIGSDTSGIIELPDNLKVGTDIKAIYPIDDIIIEVDNKSLTNRPDLWGHYGLAREFATIFGRELKPMQKQDLTEYANLPKLDIAVETPSCFRYSSISVDNVTEKRSPQLMRLRLNYCGMRDINLLADITNYLMLEMGQPMHAFDHEQVKGVRVITTNQPTPMLTLEGGGHIVPTNSTLICDEQYTPVAIAGVKGGLKSGITDKTNSLLLESATFDAMAIRKSSRTIGLITDASLRYEKSLDPEMTVDAIARLLYLLKDIDKNIKVSSSLTDVYNYHYPTREIVVDAGFINRRGGVNIDNQQVENILARLGFIVKRVGDKLSVKVPSFRATKDISIKEDLVEEVLRMYGYDNIKPAPMTMPLISVEQLPIHIFEYKTKHLLATKYNLNELHSYIWNYKDFNISMGIEQTPVVELLDSSNSGQSGIRTHLFPTLLKMFHENRNSYSNIGMFEVGRVADAIDKNQLVVERKKLAIVLASTTESEKTLYFRLKQIVEDLACILNVKVDYVGGKVANYFHPINSTNLSSNANNFGEMGVIHPSVNRALDKRFNLVGLELDMDKLLAGEQKATKKIVASKYQPVDLDFNFVMDENIPYAYLQRTLEQFKCNYILETSLKDVYVNSEVLPGKKSYTLSMRLTPKDKTLEAGDIEKFSKRLISYMENENIILRV